MNKTKRRREPDASRTKHVRGSHADPHRNSYSAAFIIRCRNIHPAEITKLMGIIPTDFVVKGTLNHRGEKRPFNTWSHYLNVDEYTALDIQIRKLIKKFSKKKAALKFLAKRRAELILYCGYFNHKVTATAAVDWKLLKEISSLYASFQVTVYPCSS